ncbi:MAG: peptidase, partial [Planctomycetes bacterium]|nr:peptidase [Planctomycetota bacterium]
GLGSFVEKPTPLDEFGRRRIRIRLADGTADIVQGVTLITPRYYQLKTLSVGRRLLLDQRYATSNLSGAELLAVLRYATKDKKPEVRRNVVKLLLQADRYAEAKDELETLAKTYPQMEGIADMLRDLPQLRARTVLVELRRRQEAGQPALVRRALEKFPTTGVDGQILFQVREMIKQDLETQKDMDALKTDMKQRVSKIEDQYRRQQLGGIVEEICSEMTLINMPRLSAYRRLASDTALSDTDKVALAVSGWLLGADEAMPMYPRAQSLITVRNYIREFLGEPLKANRDALLAQIRSQEGGSAPLVARLLAAMKPVGTLPETVNNVPGFYQLSVPGRDKAPDVSYHVQLPPEYDPYRRYPVVVSLHGQSTTPAQQVDWWAGTASENGHRGGQATRQGYIVIAPQWGAVGQRQYEYTFREHMAVLDTLRDACRRFAIDTDRVYLTGHAMGGDAAWDIALGHPDLWAGVIPIVATADTQRYNYCKIYWPNAQSVPFYFVGGEYDGAKRAKNGAILDRYLRSLKYDAMVVEYLGRGHENFSDEVVRIFDWMGRHQRNFFPKDIDNVTLRSYDNFFWWIEINRFQPGVTVDPQEWPGRGPRTLKITGKIGVTDQFIMVRAATGKGATTIWLSPELVDFNKRIRVALTGRPEVNTVRPDVGVILDDARTRGDRQHPFWARVDFP